MRKHGLLLLLGLAFGGQVCLAEDVKISQLPPPPQMYLQGGVQQTYRMTNPQFCPPVQGFGAYQQGWFALGQRQYQYAADYFQIAGDQMEATMGVTKFTAEARFAEAQTRKLLGQYDRSRDMYKRAIAMFEQVDPKSFYLTAAKGSLKELSPKYDNSPAPVKSNKPLKAELKQNVALLKSMPDLGYDKVEEDVPLSGNVTQLDNGVDITSLHDGDFFNRSRGTIPQAAGVDISDKYLKDVIHKAFLKMNCVETTIVGANHYTANVEYKPLRSKGKPIAVGAGSDLLCPTAELRINRRICKVPMDLPNISPNTRNVLLVTDDRHILAIDPRTNEVWKLCSNFKKKVPDFWWWKLQRQKGKKF